MTLFERSRDSAAGRWWLALWARLSGNQRGALWMILAASGFTLNGALVKWLAGSGMDPFQIALARAFFALAALSPFIWRAGIVAFRTSHPWVHVVRGVAGGAAMMAGFYSLAHLPLADVTALGFTQPLFTIVLAVLILREPVRWRRWTATVVGFFGVLLMVRPGASAFDPTALAALSMAFLIALAVTMVKLLPRNESQVAMLTYFGVASVLLAAVPAAIVWQAPSPGQWVMLAGVGVLGMASQACVISAYKVGEATFVAPFDYSKLILATLIGFYVFLEVPDLWSLAGALVIVVSTLYIARREAKQKPEAAIPPRTEPTS